MMNWSLFCITSSDFLFMFFFRKNNLISKVKKKLQNNFVEIFFVTLEEINQKHQLHLSQLDKVYAGIGPGSFTTHRAIIVFLKTLVVLKPNLQIWTINNLLFQASVNKDVISVMTLSRQKVCWQKFNSLQSTSSIHIVAKEELPTLCQNNSQFIIHQDFVGFNLWKHFQMLIHSFTLVTNAVDLKPTEVELFTH